MVSFSTIMDGEESAGSSLFFSVDETWTQGRTVYGGMQGAIAIKAMRSALNDISCYAPLRSLQVTFVGPVGVGRVEVTAKILRQGKSATQIQATIVEGDKIRLIAIGIFGSDRPSEIHDIPLAPHCKKSLSESDEIEFAPALMPAFLQHFVNRPAEPLKIFTGEKQPHGITYAKHRGVKVLTEEHLVAIADISPPVAMAAMTKFAPASSMNWQLEFVQTPEQLAQNEWFRVDAEMLAGVDGYNWQNTNFWSEDGKLAMLSRQCLAVFG